MNFIIFPLLLIVNSEQTIILYLISASASERRAYYTLGRSQVRKNSHSANKYKIQIQHGSKLRLLAAYTLRAEFSRRLAYGSQEPPPQQQQVPTGAPSAEAASAGDEQVAAVSAEPQQSAQQLALESRESSAESLFTDPLTSPVAAAATLAAPLPSPQQQGDSVASSYHSDAGEAMLVTAAPQSAAAPAAAAVAANTPETSSPDDLLSEILNCSSDLMTKSFASVGNVGEEAAGLPMRTASGGAFTLVRHKKVELTPLTTEATADLVGVDTGEF